MNLRAWTNRLRPVRKLMNESHIRNVIEAALLAAGKPLQPAELVELFDEGARPQLQDIQAALAALMAEYSNRGIEIKETAAGFRIQVRREMANEISRLWPERPARYSRALLETLALIAYRQPITRAEIEAVRGVAVNPNILKTVIERNWVRVVGHRDVPGRPELLGTTRDFLDYFGLKNLDELPPLAELKVIGDIKVQFDLPDPGPVALASDANGDVAQADAGGVEGAAAGAAAEVVDAAAKVAEATDGEQVASESTDGLVGVALPGEGNAIDAESTADARAADVGTDGAAGVGTAGAADVGASSAVDVGADGAADVGATGAADVGAAGAVDVGATGAADVGAAGAADVGADGAADVGASSAVDVGAAGATGVGTDGAAHVGAEGAAVGSADAGTDGRGDRAAGGAVGDGADGESAARESSGERKPAGDHKKPTPTRRGAPDSALYEAEEFAASIDADLAAGDDDGSEDDELSASGPGSSELVAGPRDIDD
jgi:segregation and condensation protein B